MSLVKGMLVASTVALTAGAASPAVAQQTPATQSTAAQSGAAQTTIAGADAGADTLQDIVITARKRAENLRDVPVSVQAVTGNELVTKSITQLPDLVSLVPNFRVSFATSSPFSLIRGFGSGSSLSFEQSVGKFVDNVSYGRDQDARIPLFDVDRVEVLKGPQVLVFGNSTTAGAVSIITRKPGSEFIGDASIGYEFNAHQVIAQGGVTLPIGNSASVRLAGLFDDQSKGWIFNPLTGNTEPRNRNYAGRATLRLAPASGLEILLKAEVDRVKNQGNTIEPIRQPTNALAQFAEVNLDLRRSVNNNVAPFFEPEFARLNNETYQADINYDVLGGTLTSISALRHLRYLTSLTNFASIPIFDALIGQQYRQFSQELRYGGKVGRLDLTVGGYYQHDELRSFTSLGLNLGLIGLPASRGGFPFANLFIYDHNTNSYSAFADFTYHLTDAFSISAGARYTNIKKRASQSSNPANLIPGLGFDFTREQLVASINNSPQYVTAALNAARASPHNFTDLALDEDHLQPQIVGQYEFAPRNMLYVKYVKGAKAGGYDQNYALAARPAPFLSEGGQAVEAGIKGLTANSRFEYSIVAFRETFDNLQVSVFQNPNTVVANIGKARSQGVEAEATLLLARGFRVSTNLAYLDAKYLQFPNAPCTIAQTLATPSGTTCVQDRSNTPTILSSKWTGSLNAQYDQDVLGGDYVLTTGASLYARSRYNASTTNDPLFLVNGYAQIDANIDFKPMDGWWTVSLFGRNLTDYHYIDYATTSTFLTGAGGVSSSRGRQIGLRLSTRF